VKDCKVQVKDRVDLNFIVDLLKTLKYKTTLEISQTITGVAGTITFEKLNEYVHPYDLNDQDHTTHKREDARSYLKASTQRTENELTGRHLMYLNDVGSESVRISESFKAMSIKTDFIGLMRAFWFDSANSPIFNNDYGTYVLGRVQCQNSDGRKWYGDTRTLKPFEKVVKCVWYRDDNFYKFYTYMQPLITDVFNVYLLMGNWALKKKKISFKVDSHSDQIIKNILEEFGLTNLANNLRCLATREIFLDKLRDLPKTTRKLYTNMRHVFEDAAQGEEDQDYENMSLMNLREHHELSSGNNYHLILYVLPPEEKLLFASKS
jgi:hypothetical protein